MEHTVFNADEIILMLQNENAELKQNLLETKDTLYHEKCKIERLMLQQIELLKMMLDRVGGSDDE